MGSAALDQILEQIAPKIAQIEIHIVDDILQLPMNANAHYPDLATGLAVASEDGGRLWRVEGEEGVWYEPIRPEVAFL